ncbi:hypothetical protein [Paraflavitalea speifideaquila]|uniref:hypothetical protein n=1 Tax=Paraflavitalea speifideaquila TaxID=3076558 RepID=UPI0028E1E9FA|nr:hypothetical protein [Paraflavitalea speifideiaquila]
MRLLPSALLFFLVVCVQMSSAQQKQPNAHLQPTHTIPFRLTNYNNIAVQAILNNQDTVVLMFHTVANSMTLTEAATQKLKSLHFEGADSVKSWGGADNTARFSKGNLLQIGNQQWKDVAIWENKNSGYAGAVLLDDQFTNDHKISEKLTITSTKELKDSYGNVLKTRKAILPAFTIGKVKLSEVPVGFFEGAIGRQKMSIIGGDILKRFNWIIDAQRNYVYLKPSKLKNTSYSNI